MVARTKEESDPHPRRDGPVDPLASLAREEFEKKGEDPAAVVQEVEQREQHDCQTGEEVPDAGTDVGGVGGDRVPAVGEEALQPVAPGADVEPSGIEVERPALQPVDQLVEAADHIAGQRGGLTDDLGGDQGEHTGDQRQAAEDGDGGRRSARQPPLPQPVCHGLQQGGHQDGDGDGHQHFRQIARDPAKAVDHGGDGDQAPAPGGGDLKPPRHDGIGLWRRRQRVRLDRRFRLGRLARALSLLRPVKRWLGGTGFDRAPIDPSRIHRPRTILTRIRRLADTGRLFGLRSPGISVGIRWFSPIGRSDCR